MSTSVSRQAFPTLVQQGKDYSGLVTANHLGALFGEKPIEIGGFVDALQRTYSEDDLISKIMQYPTMYIEDDREYEWYLQGAYRKNIPLIEARAMDDTVADSASELGLQGTRFKLVFGEELFFKTHIITGPSPDTYHVLIKDVEQEGSNFVYICELFTGDPTLYLPYEEITPNTRWCVSHSQSEQTLSKEGSDISFTSPFKMRNRISMLRKQHLVSGDTINKKGNEPIVFGWSPDGKTQFKTWLKKQDWEFMQAVRREKAALLMYGKSNRRADGTYGNIGKSGYEIKAGLGLREQISPANIHRFNTFDIESFVDYLMGLSVGKLPEDQRRFVVGTGEWGLVNFTRAVENYSAASQLEYNRINVFNGVDNASYTEQQFVKAAFVNGIKIEMMHLPEYDDDIRNTKRDYRGRLLESQRMTIMDFGTASGQPNIQMVRVQADSYNPQWKYIEGLRSPFMSSGSQDRPGVISTPVDGYEIHYADWCGCRIANPMRTGEWIPSEL